MTGRDPMSGTSDDIDDHKRITDYGPRYEFLGYKCIECEESWPCETIMAKVDEMVREEE